MRTWWDSDPRTVSQGWLTGYQAARTHVLAPMRTRQVRFTGPWQAACRFKHGRARRIVAYSYAKERTGGEKQGGEATRVVWVLSNGHPRPPAPPLPHFLLVLFPRRPVPVIPAPVGVRPVPFRGRALWCAPVRWLSSMDRPARDDLRARAVLQFSFPASMGGACAIPSRARPGFFTARAGTGSGRASSRAGAVGPVVSPRRSRRSVQEAPAAGLLVVWGVLREVFLVVHAGEGQYRLVVVRGGVAAGG